MIRLLLFLQAAPSCCGAAHLLTFLLLLLLQHQKVVALSEQMFLMVINVVQRVFLSHRRFLTPTHQRGWIRAKLLKVAHLKAADQKGKTVGGEPAFVRCGSCLLQNWCIKTCLESHANHKFECHRASITARSQWFVINASLQEEKKGRKKETFAILTPVFRVQLVLPLTASLFQPIISNPRLCCGAEHSSRSLARFSDLCFCLFLLFIYLPRQPRCVAEGLSTPKGPFPIKCPLIQKQSPTRLSQYRQSFCCVQTAINQRGSFIKEQLTTSVPTQHLKQGPSESTGNQDPRAK